MNLCILSPEIYEQCLHVRCWRTKAGQRKHTTSISKWMYQ